MNRTGKSVGAGVKQCKLRAIYCHFEPDVFDKIKKMAEENNSSFSEQVRTIIEWGLETIHTEDE